MRFLISFLVSVLNQLWILRGHFLCCRSLMRLQGTPYCGGGEEKQKKIKLNRGSSKNLLRFSSSRRSHCWYTLRWSWKLTFSPQAWQEQREWSSWAAWSPLAMRCLRPHMRLWWWPACCPPPSLQTATTNKKDDDDGNIQTVTADVREKQTFIYHVREPWLHFELFKKAFLLRQVGRWTAG